MNVCDKCGYRWISGNTCPCCKHISIQYKWKLIKEVMDETDRTKQARLLFKLLEIERKS
ncbi:MAG: hypothetical protein GY861_25105 [bacterium]|nr:hypothetical protein [bacterium]